MTFTSFIYFASVPYLALIYLYFFSFFSLFYLHIFLLLLPLFPPIYALCFIFLIALHFSRASHLQYSHEVKANGLAKETALQESEKFRLIGCNQVKI